MLMAGSPSHAALASNLKAALNALADELPAESRAQLIDEHVDVFRYNAAIMHAFQASWRGGGGDRGGWEGSRALLWLSRRGSARLMQARLALAHSLECCPCRPECVARQR
jgi:hypothetical protein